MFKPAYRLFGMLALFVCLLLQTSEARASVGAAYSVFGFRPYLERGYNTRLGWQGWPVTAADSHLYLYSADNLRMLSEMEYLYADGLIHTQLLKIYQPAGGLGDQEWNELEYFALEASGNRLGSAQLHGLVSKQCQGEWRQGPNFITLISERTATWLRISDHGSPAAPPLEQCLKRPG
ncbi:MAG: hypothetical protein ACAI44_05295 [Candidatus Sericytochromatia bacterium]